MKSRTNKSLVKHAIDDHRVTSAFDPDHGMIMLKTGGPHTGNTQRDKIMNINSLQDLRFELEKNPSPDNVDLLLVADLIVRFFTRPAHQITIEAIRRNKGNLMFFFSFLHMPIESIDHFVGLTSAMVAKAYRLVEENSAATEANAPRSTLANCAEQVLKAMPPQTTGPRPVLY